MVQKSHSSNRSFNQNSVHKDLKKSLSELGAQIDGARKPSGSVLVANVHSQNVGASEENSHSLQRKRKRKVNDSDDDNLENQYLQGLTHGSATEDGRRNRHRYQQGQHEEVHSAAHEGLQSPESDADKPSTIILEHPSATLVPQHEAISLPDPKSELEKASRTVFLGNVSTVAIKSKSARATLIVHLESFIASLPEGDIAHKIESIRFRSTAFSNNGLPKKAAYARKELMDSTTKGTNAYVVYTTQSAAREAVNKLNGTVIFDRHLRVDGVAHPTKVDHRRCVFVGNLGFVDDESSINAAKDEENNRRPRKVREPADAEEGLWRQFSKAGVVESVRVIRDKATRVGKGFAYVQFQVRCLLSAIITNGSI